MKTKKQKKGISLITLVITIIVIIILAAAVILTLNRNNPINTAKEATFKSDVKNIESELGMYISKRTADTLGDTTQFDKEKLNLNETTTPTINEVLTSLKGSKLEGKVEVRNGKLVFKGEDENEITWFNTTATNKKEAVKSTEIWYKIDGTTLHLSNSDLGGYLQHDESSMKIPEWTGIFVLNNPITNVIIENEIVPLETYYWFNSCDNLIEIKNISKLNTSNVTSMDYMFNRCALTSLDVSNFDTSNVTSMSHMFNGCSELTSLDVSNFDTNKVTNMSGMFSGCSGLTSLDLSEFDTSNVTSMYYMFKGCSGLTSLDLSEFDTSNVTGMNNMFDGCSGLTSLDLSSFDTNKVNSKGDMLKSVTCPVYVGEKWTLTEADTGYSGTFQ